MTIDYDKCPEAYDLQELMERADFAVTYLGNKIRDMVARGIMVKQSVMSSPPTFTMTPDHNWEITGYVQMCDSPIRYNYVAKLYMQTSETDTIKIYKYANDELVADCEMMLSLLTTQRVQTIIEELNKHSIRRDI